MTNEQKIIKATRAGVVVNILLMAFKFAAAFFGHSAAMTADAVHSAVDILSSFFVIVGVKSPGKRKGGASAALAVSVLLFALGCFLGYRAVAVVAAAAQSGLARPGVIAIVAAAVSIVLKEYMFHATRRVAAETGSGGLFADAWHHRSDAISSVGSLAGILGARLLFPMLDHLAAVIVCLFVLKASFDVFMDAVSLLSGSECDEKALADIRAVILQEEGVLASDSMKALKFKDGFSLDFVIYVRPEQSLSEAHEIADRVKASVEQAFKCRSCMVHVEPMQ